DAGQFSWSLVTVNKKPDAAAIKIGQTLADSSLSGADTNVTGTWTFTDPTYAPASADQNVSVTFTPDDDENYEPITREVNVHVLYEPRTISFTGSNSASWVKGTYDASVETSFGGGKVTYSVLSGTCSIDENGILTAIENGTCTFRATVANDGIYESVSVDGTATLRTYLVTFGSNNGSAVDPQHLDVFGTLAAPADPTRAGYTFLGWSDSDGGESVSFPYTPDITTDITLYALWSADKHSVTFDSKSGSAVAAGSFVTDGSLAIPFDPTRTGYSFLGWSDSDGGESITFPYSPDSLTDVTLYALWSADSHVVNLGVNGGTVLFVTDGSIDEPAAPSRAGYTFVGWSLTDGGDALVFPYTPGVIEDLTFYPLWSADSHVVNLGVNGGTVSFVTDGSIDEPAAPSRAGYTFQGWSATDGGSVLSFPYAPGVTTDITLYALWSADSHTVTFNSKGGTAVSAGSFVTDGSLAIPFDPTRAGYTFVGWSLTDGGSAITFPYTPGVTTGITVYALWSADSHVVTFNSKSGSTVADDSFLTDGSLAMPFDPTRAGYTFLGWSDSDGGESITFPYAPGVITDVTLYALWSADSHLVSFNHQGGSLVTDGSFETDGTVAAPAPTTRAGYTF
ncbi:MAG: InlB B-repeat-containing protein, partial [Hyphomicrobiales bacterium]